MPFEKIEQRHRGEDKEQNRQPQIHIQHLRQNRAAEVQDGRNRRVNTLIGGTVNQRARQETDQAGNQIIEIALAATGDTGARSETGAGHPDAKDQASDEIADDERRRHGG